MKYDFQAQYSIALYDRIAQQQAIDYLSNSSNHLPRGWPDLEEVADDGARLQLLAQAIISPSKNRARVGDIRGKTGGLHHWIVTHSDRYLQNQLTLMQDLQLLPTLPQITTLPRYSFGLQFDFTLRSPYLSKDDTEFHILDNPVRKDKVFKLPMVAPSSWKGVLRMVLREHAQSDEIMNRLFGQANDNDETGSAGRLQFYPTFFNQMGLEVLNPHERHTGAGKLPIYIESVPIGATGTFTLLYTPLDRLGENEAETKQQVFADLQLVAEGLEAMFTVYGFGAKTSSGFGLATNSLGDGHLQIVGLNMPDESLSESARSMIDSLTFTNWNELQNKVTELLTGGDT